MNREFTQMIQDQNVEQGAELLENAKRVLERALEELTRYQERYAGYETETLSSATNYLACNLLGNFRLDLFVTYAGKIEAMAALLKEEK